MISVAGQIYKLFFAFFLEIFSTIKRKFCRKVRHRLSAKPINLARWWSQLLGLPLAELEGYNVRDFCGYYFSVFLNVSFCLGLCVAICDLVHGV